MMMYLRGRSWQDWGGDHWRAGDYAGERGKRKGRDGELFVVGKLHGGSCNI